MSKKILKITALGHFAVYVYGRYEYYTLIKS